MRLRKLGSPIPLSIALLFVIILIGIGIEHTLAAHAGAKSVAIDILPGDSSNEMNPRFTVHLPVAILSTETFDAQKVNPETVALDGTRVAKRRSGGYRVFYRDVNGDGRVDMIATFVVRNLKRHANGEKWKLAGATFDGDSIEGSDQLSYVDTVPLALQPSQAEANHVTAKKVSAAPVNQNKSPGVTPEGSSRLFSNPATINIPVNPVSGGIASPYPSNITITNASFASNEVIGSMVVNINGLQHCFVDDVDILLVGPTGAAMTIMSDVGGSTTTSNVPADCTSNPATGTAANLIFDDGSVALIDDNGPLASGRFKPTDVGATDTFPAPAPGSFARPATAGDSATDGIPGATLSSTFGLTNPVGTWSLYVMDNVAGDGGRIINGWSMQITPALQFHGGAVTINDNTTATPYPSIVTVPSLGATPRVNRAMVQLLGFTHGFPDDVDMLLVGPTGANAIIMSDVGGSISVSNINMDIYDTSGPQDTTPPDVQNDPQMVPMPDIGPLVSAKYYQPTNVGAGDPFPAPAPAPSGGSALSVFTNTDPTGQWSLFVVDDAAGQSGSMTDWTLNLVTTDTATAGTSTISGRVTTPDGAPLEGVEVELNGSRSARTITDSAGRYEFTDVETGSLYTLVPSRANYSFTPRQRTFSLNGSLTDAVFTAQPDTIQTLNPIDSSYYFVRQQYLDFLGREPDQGGLDFWSAKLTACGADSDCLLRARAGVASAFFMSDEFQQSGYYVYRLYKAALGRRLSFDEFSADRAQVPVGANRVAFADSFVERAEFLGRYNGATTAENFVDRLLQTILQSSGVDLSAQRDSLLASYRAGTNTAQSRSLVLRSAIEDASFRQAEYNRAFVQMQYFGYLKRNPDQNGYDFWVDVLNNRVPGNYQSMVCAFLTSAEYQRRFSPVLTRSNNECG